MRIEISKEARKDLEGFEKNIQKELFSAIENLEIAPIPENSMHIELGNAELFRLKLQEEDRNSRINHRIFYEIKEPRIIVRAVYHRKEAYSNKAKKEIESRVQ